MISRVSAFAAPRFCIRDDFTESGSASSDLCDTVLEPQPLVASAETIQRLKAAALVATFPKKRAKEARHRCPACELEFFFKDGLLKHIRSEHPLLRVQHTPVVKQCHSFPPDVQKFIGKSGDAEKPYQCTFPACGKTYTRRHILAHHVKVKHTETPPQTFSCQFPECGRSYELLNSLLRHQRLEGHEDECEASAEASSGDSGKELEEFIDGL